MRLFSQEEARISETGHGTKGKRVLRRQPEENGEYISRSPYRFLVEVLSFK
jgi:hypothetical protein